ncbi:MAG: S41 family peptidase [Chitinophagaceae bacterium]|nr:S41 family peptidase [Anaerolineae bacterium]
MRFVQGSRYLILSVLLLFMSASASAQNTTDIAGIWRTEGYAWVFDISSTSVTAYQVTDATCVSIIETEDIAYETDSVLLRDVQFPGIAALLAEPSDVLLTLAEDVLIFDEGGVVPIHATRIDALPPSCLDGIEDPTDPEANFEAFWNMFAENYAFFDLYGVDWNAVYDTYRPQVNADTSDAELFDILQATMAGITDAHINIIASPIQVFSAGQYAEWTQDQDEEVIAEYVNLIVDNYLIDEPQLLANEQIIYGHLSETVGYINFLSMYEFSTDGDDIAALESAMATLLADLSDVETIVIDVRFNPGGADKNAVYIAGYFTDVSTLAFSKQVWDGETFLELHDITIEPTAGEHFSQDVYLLTSNFTTSGGEVFTMAMTALPQVITVGETTQGAFSDILIVFPPNGWLVTLSNERYISHDGQVVESLGILPMIEEPMTSEALQAGVDPVIDRVLMLIDGQ